MKKIKFLPGVNKYKIQGETVYAEYMADRKVLNAACAARAVMPTHSTSFMAITMKMRLKTIREMTTRHGVLEQTIWKKM